MWSIITSAMGHSCHFLQRCAYTKHHIYGIIVLFIVDVIICQFTRLSYTPLPYLCVHFSIYTLLLKMCMWVLCKQEPIQFGLVLSVTFGHFGCCCCWSLFIIIVTTNQWWSQPLIGLYIQLLCSSSHKCYVFLYVITF